jgi:hypothetical protein
MCAYGASAQVLMVTHNGVFRVMADVSGGGWVGRVRPAVSPALGRVAPARRSSRRSVSAVYRTKIQPSTADMIAKPRRVFGRQNIDQFTPTGQPRQKSMLSGWTGKAQPRKRESRGLT